MTVFSVCICKIECRKTFICAKLFNGIVVFLEKDVNFFLSANTSSNLCTLWKLYRSILCISFMLNMFLVL